MTTKTTIVICPKCEGYGKIYSQELVDYHRNDYVTKSEKCYVCDGSGRLKQIESSTFEKMK